MVWYIAKRLLYSLLTIFVVITITFFLMNAIPGKFYTSEKALPASVIKNIEKYYGLDKPLVVQYITYLNNVAHLDLGPSMYKRGRTVNSIIKDHFPYSARIGSIAVVMALTFGTLFGILAAMWRNKWPDYVFMLVATLGITIPGFVVASLLEYYLGVKLQILPFLGLETWKHYIMPCFALSFFPLSFITRLVRTNMSEVLEQDYIRTARSKGINERVVLYKHALKNAILPVVTYLGPMLAFILTGSFVIEKIFGIPGLGYYFITSISNRDYPVIMGTTLFLATLIVTMNFLVDIIYMFIDPRIKINK